MQGDDNSSAEQPVASESEHGPESESGSEPRSESPAPTNDGRRLSRWARLFGNVALGVLLVVASALLLSFGRPGQRIPYAVFLLAAAPLLLGYRGTDAVPRPLAGIAAAVAVFLVGTWVFDTVAAAVAVQVTGMDPISARFAVEHGVNNATILALLAGTLWAWLLAPGAVELARDPPGLLSGLPRPSGPGIPPQGVVVAFAVVVVAGTLSPAFLAGYYPVTTAETPGGTFDHGGVAVTVTDIERFDADAPVTVGYGSLARAEPAPDSGEIVLVRVRTRDHGTGDAPSPDIRLVTPAADEGDRVRERVDTVIQPSGNPLFDGTEVPAERVRVAERNYTVYNADNRTGRTTEGWILFRRPPGTDDAGSYVRIRVGSPGPAGKWPLPES